MKSNLSGKSDRTDVALREANGETYISFPRAGSYRRGPALSRFLRLAHDPAPERVLAFAQVYGGLEISNICGRPQAHHLHEGCNTFTFLPEDPHLLDGRYWLSDDQVLISVGTWERLHLWQSYLRLFRTLSKLLRSPFEKRLVNIDDFEVLTQFFSHSGSEVLGFMAFDRRFITPKGEGEDDTETGRRQLSYIGKDGLIRQLSPLIVHSDEYVPELGLKRSEASTLSSIIRGTKHPEIDRQAAMEWFNRFGRSKFMDDIEQWFSVKRPAYEVYQQKRSKIDYMVGMYIYSLDCLRRVDAYTYLYELMGPDFADFRLYLEWDDGIESGDDQKLHPRVRPAVDRYRKHLPFDEWLLFARLVRELMDAITNRRLFLCEDCSQVYSLDRGVDRRSTRSNRRYCPDCRLVRHRASKRESWRRNAEKWRKGRQERGVTGNDGEA